MNKYEVSEIKKNFSDNSDILVMHDVLTVIASEDGVRYKDIKSSIQFDEYGKSLVYDTLKKILSTKVGKNLKEFRFPNAEYAEDGVQTLFYNLKNTGFKNEEYTDKFIDRIVSNHTDEGIFSFISAHCTYTVFHKNTDDTDDKYNSEDYNFIITAFCPVSRIDNGFSYSIDGEFSGGTDEKLYISKKPTDGILFPAFNDRTSDVNSVMYYASNTKQSDISIVNDILGCEWTRTAEEDKMLFNEILENVYGSYITYEFISKLNLKIFDYIASNKEDTEIPMIDLNVFKTLIKSVGEEYPIDNFDFDALEAVYNASTDNIPMVAANVLQTTDIINSTGFSVRIKDRSLCKTEKYTIDGKPRTRIIIDVPDEFTVNDCIVG